MREITYHRAVLRSRPPQPVHLRLGHSPDPDDAFMWWPLLELDGAPTRIDTGRFRFEAVMDDIESLNRRAESGELEITAMSCAQYPRVHATYAITACGASLGDGYGPKVVAREPMTVEQLREADLSMAVPGTRTSAFGAVSLLLAEHRLRFEVVPFDEIIDAVASGRFDIGLVIHEGQLTFQQQGLCLVCDLGRWWKSRHNLPLPLGINALRRDLDGQHGDGTMEQVTALLRRSVEYALEHRRQSIRYALPFARGMDESLADEFVQMYVNRWTLDFGEEGRLAVRTFLEALHAADLAPEAGELDFVTAEEAPGGQKRPLWRE